MNLTDMTNETRVRVVNDFELHCIGRLRPGMLGTVGMTGGDGVTAPFCVVRMDDKLSGDNRVPVWADEVGTCTAADFEPAEG